MPVELSRRDAAAALAALGIGAGVSGRLVERFDDDSLAETVSALAAVVYPSEVEPTGEFVRTYLAGRLENERDAYSYVGDSFDALDEYAMRLFSRQFADLRVTRRDDVLREMGVDAVRADRNGSVPERVRYLVDELLIALFTTPTGGALVGNENPTGYPGGIESYQREP